MKLPLIITSNSNTKQHMSSDLAFPQFSKHEINHFCTTPLYSKLHLQSKYKPYPAKNLKSQIFNYSTTAFHGDESRDYISPNFSRTRSIDLKWSLNHRFPHNHKHQSESIHKNTPTLCNPTSNAKINRNQLQPNTNSWMNTIASFHFLQLNILIITRNKWRLIDSPSLRVSFAVLSQYTVRVFESEFRH